MTDKIIVASNIDGSVIIIHPTPEMFDAGSRTRQELAARGIVFEDDQSVLQYIIDKDVPAGLSYRITDKSSLPADREFRAAWTDAFPTETVDIDVDKAIEIKKDSLRELRKPILDKLDIDYIRAQEINDVEAKAAIIAKKQELRDMPEQPFPQDIEELKAYMPECLIGE